MIDNNYLDHFDEVEGIEFNLLLNTYMESVFTALGGGFKESIYQHSLGIEFRRLGFNVQKETNIAIFYRGEEVGTVRIDMLVDRKYFIEFKAMSKITEKEINKVKRYLNLLRGDGVVCGFIINVKLDRYEIITVQ